MTRREIHTPARGQRFAQVLCVLLALVASLPGVLALTLSIEAVRQRIQLEAENLLRDQFGLTARFQVRVRAWPPSAIVDNLVLESTDGTGPALSAQRVTVSPRLFSLLDGRISADEIEVDRPVARLQLTNGQIDNLKIKPQPARPPSESSSAPFGSISINGAHIDIEIDGVRGVANEVDADVSTQGPSFEVAMHAGRIELHHVARDAATGSEAGQGHYEDVICRIDARANVRPGGVDVHRLLLEGGVDLNPKGATLPPCALDDDDVRRLVVELRRASVDYDKQGLRHCAGEINVRGPLPAVNRYVSFLPLSGWVGVDAEVGWDRGDPLPQVQAKLTGAELQMGIYHLGKTLKGQVKLSNGTVRVPTMDVGFADGNVALKDIVVQPLEEGIPLQGREVRIDGLSLAGLMRDLGVSDHAHVQMQFDEGTLRSIEGHIDPLRIDSKLTTHVSEFEVFDRGHDDPARTRVLGVHSAVVSAGFAVRPKAVEFQNAVAHFGGSTLNVSTSLGFANEFGLRVHPGSIINLADISPIVDIPWSGEASVQVGITGTFDNPAIKGDLSIKDMVFADMRFGQIERSHVSFTPLTVLLQDLHGVKGHSDYSTEQLELNFNGPASVAVSGRLHSDSMDARDFLSVFRLDEDPRFEAIHGRGLVDAVLSYELGGPADKCGDGRLSVRANTKLKDLDLFDEKFEAGDASVDVRLVDPAAQASGVEADIQTFSLRKRGGSILGNAIIRPGGIIRARAVADGIPLGELNALGAAGALLDGTVSATADVYGTLDRLAADVDVRVSPIRIGNEWFPPSRVAVRLVPTDPFLQVVGRTRCGQPIQAPFDPKEYDRDLPAGVFLIEGQLLGGQMALRHLEVTRQRNMVAHGTIEALALDVGKLLRVAQPGKGDWNGKLSGVLDVANFSPDALDQSDMTLSLKTLAVQGPSGVANLREGTHPITLKRDALVIPGLLLDLRAPGGLSGTFHAKGRIDTLTHNPQVDLTARLLPTDLSMLSGMIPRIERARGKIHGDILVRGPLADPTYSGSILLDDGGLRLTDFPVSFDDVRVVVRLAEREIRLEEAYARVGGGTVRATGTLPVQGFDLGTATAQLTARDVSMVVREGIAMRLNADLSASWIGTGDNIPRVVGDVSLLGFDYTRPVRLEANLNLLDQRVGKKHVELYDPKDDVVDLELRIHAVAPLRFRNNLTDLQLTLDSENLLLVGSNQRVGLQGALRVKPGGWVRLRNNEFEVRTGVVRFDDPTRIAPLIDVTALTEYSRYSQGSDTGPEGAAGQSVAQSGQWRIQLHAYGDEESLRLDLTSEPALSQEDILLLLTLGVTRAELDRMNASSLGGTAALEALSSVTGADAAVTDTIPVIDEFRVGSAYSTRTGRTQPTLTIGKRVSERVRASVTSGVSEGREVRSNLEWQLTGNTSVLGSYDNVNNVSNSALGNVGADIRFRIAFE